jgi:hypothetical protein
MFDNSWVTFIIEIRVGLVLALDWTQSVLSIDSRKHKMKTLHILSPFIK